MEAAIQVDRSLTDWDEYVRVLERLDEPVPAEGEYWNAPGLRTSYARSIAISRYREHLGSSRDGPPELEAVVQAEIERLRAEADIQIFPH